MDVKPFFNYFSEYLIVLDELLTNLQRVIDLELLSFFSRKHNGVIVFTIIEGIYGIIHTNCRRRQAEWGCPRMGEWKIPWHNSWRKG